MRRPDTFVVEGLILAVLSERACRVELPNGHKLLGFLTGKARAAGASMAAGQKVRLRLSPADLSHGRILADGPVQAT